MAVYDPNKPQPTDRITATWRDIRDNFATAYNYFNIDHGDLDDDDVNERGVHQRVTFIRQAAAPSTGATEIAAYTKTNGNTVDLYGRSHTDGAEFPITSGTALNTGINLEAYALIELSQFVNVSDVEFKIPEMVYEEDGQEITRRMASDNIDSVTNITASNLLRCRIAFSPALSTANIFWSLDVFAPTIAPVVNTTTIWQNLQPVADAAYSASITTSKFDFGVYARLPADVNARRILYVLFKAYTVAT